MLRLAEPCSRNGEVAAVVAVPKFDGVWTKMQYKVPCSLCVAVAVSVIVTAVPVGTEPLLVLVKLPDMTVGGVAPVQLDPVAWVMPKS